MKCFILVFVLGVLFSCGTLGHIQFYNIQASKEMVDSVVIKLSTNTPIPNKWKKYVQSMDFLDEKFYYFDSSPEEVYRFGCVGDSLDWKSHANCKIALYGIFDGKSWRVTNEINKEEQERMRLRFEKLVLGKMGFHFERVDE